MILLSDRRAAEDDQAGQPPTANHQDMRTAGPATNREEVAMHHGVDLQVTPRRAFRTIGWWGRYRVDLLCRIGVALPLASVVLASLAVPARSTEPAVDQLMFQLLHPDAVVRDAALRTVVRRGERAAIPALIDLLYLDSFLDSSAADALERLSGQSFGHDWRRWVECLSSREDLRPHGGYAAWKAAQFRRIDPAFGEFLYAGVKHRARLEEIQWGGVRKDGIPALTNPRHVPARTATYLSPDELVLGLVVRGEARAYPLRIMDWHEMANDVVGGVAISIAY
jgi:hypothetical protein